MQKEKDFQYAKFPSFLIKYTLVFLGPYQVKHLSTNLLETKRREAC